MAENFSVNPSGYILFPSEEHLYDWLYQNFLKNFSSVEKQYPFAPSCVVDFKALDTEGKTVLVEVKNWFVKIRDMQQIMKYVVHAYGRYGAAGFRFFLVCGGIEQTKRTLLEALGVEIVLTKDLIENEVRA